MYRDYQNKVHCYQLLDKAITTFYTNLALVKSTQEQHKCESCWKDGVGMGDGAGEWRRGWVVGISMCWWVGGWEGSREKRGRGEKGQGDGQLLHTDGNSARRTLGLLPIAAQSCFPSPPLPPPPLPGITLFKSPAISLSPLRPFHSRETPGPQQSVAVAG